MDPVDGKGFAGVIDAGVMTPSGDSDYFIGTGTGYEQVNQVLQDSKYFEESEEARGSYSAPGMDVNVTWKGIEYDVDRDAADEVVTEFVQGIVRSFDDIGEEFFSEVEQEVYNSTGEVIADGGTLADIDPSNPYESDEVHDGFQKSMERGPYSEEPEK